MTLAATDFQHATDTLVAAINEHTRCACREAERQEILKIRETEVIGDVTGANEAQRKANLRAALAAEHQDLYEAELATRRARRNLDIAQARLDCLRYQLRLLENAGWGRE